jgi:hypothetical protein
VLSYLLAGVDLPLPSGFESLSEEVALAARGRHRVVIEEVDLVGYEASGLPTRTMGRDLATDPEFFSGALAAGTRLAELVSS